MGGGGGGGGCVLLFFACIYTHRVTSVYSLCCVGPCVVVD